MVLKFLVLQPISFTLSSRSKCPSNQYYGKNLLKQILLWTVENIGTVRLSFFLKIYMSSYIAVLNVTCDVNFKYLHCRSDFDP